MFTDQPMHLVVEDVGLVARHSELSDHASVFVVHESTHLSGDFNRLGRAYLRVVFAHVRLGMT